jgi:hypothetical protein
MRRGLMMPPGDNADKRTWNSVDLGGQLPRYLLQQMADCIW